MVSAATFAALRPTCTSSGTTWCSGSSWTPVRLDELRVCDVLDRDERDAEGVAHLRDGVRLHLLAQRAVRRRDLRDQVGALAPRVGRADPAHLDLRPRAEDAARRLERHLCEFLVARPRHRRLLGHRAAHARQPRRAARSTTTGSSGTRRCRGRRRPPPGPAGARRSTRPRGRSRASSAAAPPTSRSPRTPRRSQRTTMSTCTPLIVPRSTAYGMPRSVTSVGFWRYGLRYWASSSIATITRTLR